MWQDARAARHGLEVGEHSVVIEADARRIEVLVIVYGEPGALEDVGICTCDEIASE